MNQKNITTTILGEDITLAHSLGVAVAYETRTGRAFDPAELKTTTDFLNYGIVAIEHNNPGTAITFDRLLEELPAREYTELIGKITEAIVEWYALPDDGVLPPKPTTTQEEKEEQRKND